MSLLLTVQHEADVAGLDFYDIFEEPVVIRPEINQQFMLILIFFDPQEQKRRVGAPKHLKNLQN